MLARREGAGGKFLYELVYELGAADGEVRFPGLIDVAALAGTMTEVAGSGERSRGAVAVRSRPGCRGIAAGRSG